MKRLSVACVLALAVIANPLAAEMCTIDDVPAATLLLPYFEVDLESGPDVEPDGVTTLFSVNNAWPEATIAHVTIWSDLSVPVLDFSIYLSGYDVQTINLRDVLVDGVFPSTGAFVSNHGLFSDSRVSFPGCSSTHGEAPNYGGGGILSPTVLTHMRTSLTGQPSPLTGDCASLGEGDNHARGYITIDDANACSLEFPGDPGYFSAGGAGVASNDNQLWGDYFIVEPRADMAFGGPLVHIEADDQFSGGDNLYTFYARYSPFLEDQREPLARTFAVRYVSAGSFGGATDLLVWRDSKNSSESRFACGSTPAWYPLSHEEIVVFDEEENALLPEAPPVSGEPEGARLVPFPQESQRVTVGGPDFPLAPGFEQGWLFLDLDQIFLGGYQPAAPESSQAWVEVVFTAENGRYSVAFDGAQLDSACDTGTF